MIVTLAGLTNNGVYPAGLATTLTATVTGGTATKVEFFDGLTKLGEDLTAPYALTFTPSVSTSTLTAKATDALGVVVTSAILTAQFVTPLGLTFAASSGVIRSPFAANGDATVSQATTTTNPLDGGLAIYLFAVTGVEDDYQVSALVNCPTPESNAFYVGFDVDPDAIMLWDIPPTTGLQKVTVSDATLATRTWAMAAGLHRLYVRGADANSRLGQITIAKLSVKSITKAPTGIRATASVGKASVSRITTPEGVWEDETTRAETERTATVAAVVTNYNTVVAATLDDLETVKLEPSALVTRQHIADEIYNRTLAVADEVLGEKSALSLEKRDRTLADSLEKRDRKIDDTVIRDFSGFNLVASAAGTQFSTTRYPTLDLDAPLVSGNSLELATARLTRQLRHFQVDTTYFANAQSPDTSVPVFVIYGQSIVRNAGDLFYDTSYQAGAITNNYYWPSALPAPVSIEADIYAPSAYYLRGVGLSGGNLLYAGTNTLLLNLSGVFDSEATIWYRVLNAAPPVTSSPTYPWRFAASAGTVISKAASTAGVLPSPLPFRYYSYTGILKVSVGATQYLQIGVNSISGSNGTRSSAALDKTGKLYGGLLTVMGINLPITNTASPYHT